MEYKERLEYALKELESNLNYIDILRNKLLESFEEKFPECKNRYEDTISFLSYIENLLLTLHTKIDTIAHFYEMVIILEKSVKTLNALKEDMSELIPTLDLALYNISNSLIEIRSILKIENSNTSEEVQELPKIDSRVHNSHARILIDRVNIY